MGDPMLDAEVATLDEQGYVVLESVLSSSEIDGIRAALEPYLAQRVRGRNDFEGFRTERVYGLLAKSPVFAELAIHPRVLAIVDQLLGPGYLLSACLAINLEPGETAQALHFDDGFYRVPRPRPSYAITTIWAIDEFTAENGATEMVPGSHRWGDQAPTAGDAAVPVVMPAGSVVVMHGTLWHRGGANGSDHNRLGISPQYCEAWCRQQENMTLVVPPETSAALPRRAQELIGYSIHPPFMGHVNGMHPARLIDPDYAERDRKEARLATELLEGRLTPRP